MFNVPFFKINTISLHHQRGDFLIESLIGVLIMGIVSVGIGQVAEKVTKTQSQITSEEITLSKLQKMAIEGDKGTLCNLDAAENIQDLAATNGSCQTLLNVAGQPRLDSNNNAMKEFTKSTFTIGGIAIQSPRAPVLSASTTIDGSDKKQTVIVGQHSAS